MKKVTSIKEYQLEVEVKPEKTGGFVATCPQWSDCYAQGETVDEAVLEITAVAQGLIDLYTEKNINIPLKAATEKKLDNPLKLSVIVS